jgi:uncharacterized protein YndB with AHSA1/START domain
MSATRTITAQRHIPASVERVWAVLTNLDTWSDTLGAVISVERQDPTAEFGLGTRWNETRKFSKRTGTDQMQVTAFDSGRTFTVEADNPGVRYATTYTVAAEGDGSSLKIDFSITPHKRQGLLAQFVGELGMRVVRKSLARDLGDIAKAAESKR